MKKIWKVSLIILGIIIFIAIIWITLILHLFTNIKPFSPDPIYSPDRSMMVISTINYDKNIQDTYLLVNIIIQETKTKKSSIV